MKLTHFIVFIVLFLPLITLAQPPKPHTPPVPLDEPMMSEAEKYAWRLRQEVLYGVYIPKDVNEVFLELNKKVDESSKAKFKSLTEAEATSKLFFSLGRWMTHNWGLYEGSRLSKYLQDMGIHHPDNMVKFLITAYHRSITKRPLDIKALVEHYKAIEEEAKAARLNKGKVIYEDKKKVPAPSGKNGPR